MSENGSGKATVLERIRGQAPEILLEVVSVVFAVLLALATNDWWVGRQEVLESAEARSAVLEEVRSNRQELASNLEQNQHNLDLLKAGLETAEQDLEGFRVNYQVSLLTASAWQTAQMTGNVNHMDLAWVLEVSRTYELQEHFEHRQTDLVDFIAGLDVADRGPKALMKPMRTRFEALMRFNEGLLQAYDELLQAGAGQ